MNEKQSSPELPANPEDRWPKLERLTEQDVSSVGENFGLSPDQARTAILRGNNLLGATFSTEAGFQTENIPSGESIDTLITSPSRLNIGHLGVESFALYLRNDGLLSVLGLTKEQAEPYMWLPTSLDGYEISRDLWAYNLYEDQYLSKISIENDVYPHPEPTFSYGFYSREGTLQAIIPFSSSEVDRPIPLPLQNIERVFLRRAQTPEDEQRLLQYAEEADQQVLLVEQKLGLQKSFLPNTELVLSAGRRYRAFAARYRDREKSLHNLMFFTRMRIEDMRGAENRARLIRHEHLHNIDAALGDEKQPFSSLAENEIALIISKHLFDERLPPRMEHDETKFNWPEVRVIDDTFTETHVFPDCSLGHPRENIGELFVSAMNIYTDPHLQEALATQPPERRDKMMALYGDIGELVRKRVAEKTKHSKA